MSPRIVSGRVVATVIVSSAGWASPVASSMQVVADRPQRPGLRGRHDLEVAHARPAARAPVDERLGAVGEAVAVEPLEGDADGACRAIVHRVAQAAPVGRGPDPPLLAEHHRRGRVGERAHPLEVALAAEDSAALALLGEDPVEHELGRDAGVIEARQEQRRVPAHPGVADHQVLDRGPLGMAEVQRARHVRWRLDDRERRAGRDRPSSRRRRARRRRPPASARRSRPRRRAACRPSADRVIVACLVLCSRKTNARSSSGRTGRGTTCWFGDRRPWRSSRGRSVRCPLDALSGVGRHGSRATFTPADAARLAPSRARSGPSRRYSSRSSP